MNKRKIFVFGIILFFIFVAMFGILTFVLVKLNKRGIEYEITKKIKLVPLKNQPEKLDIPLKDFHIATSHNSYIGSTQFLGSTDPKYVRQAMMLGARVIELDVFPKDNTDVLKNIRNTPIVAHGIEKCEESGKKWDDSMPCPKSNIIVTVNNRNLVEYCKTIYATLPVLNGDPLFIFIENNTNSITGTNDEIANLFINQFGNILLTPKKLYSMMNNNRSGIINNIASVPIKYFLNQIILITGGGCRGKFCDISFNYYDWLNNYTNLSKKIGDEHNKMIRIYPDMEDNINQIIEGNLSLNYDPYHFFKLGCQLIALNYNIDDSHLISYLNYFNESSFIPIGTKIFS